MEIITANGAHGCTVLAASIRGRYISAPFASAASYAGELRGGEWVSRCHGDYEPRNRDFAQCEQEPPTAERSVVQVR